MADRFSISAEERSTVLKLDAPKRYRYFVKRVASGKMAWGLWEDGWALMADDSECKGLPLWPTREYAEACASDEFATYWPESIELENLLEEMLIGLEEARLHVAVFPTPSLNGVLVEPARLTTDLRDECQLYVTDKDLRDLQHRHGDLGRGNPIVPRLVISDKERSSVLKIAAPKRYSYFIKRVADCQGAWGLWEDGWAMAADDSGREALPLWSAPEYAEICARNNWAACRPEPIDLEDLFEVVLVYLREENAGVAVFPAPFIKGVLVEPAQLTANLRAERQRYE